MLELCLGVVAQQLCDSPYGALLISGESSGRTIDACKNLIREHNDIPQSKRDEFESLLARSRPLFQDRHRYVHGTAHPNASGGISTARLRRLKAGMEIAPVDLEALAKLSENMRTLSLEVLDWIAAVYGEDQDLGPEPIP